MRESLAATAFAGLQWSPERERAIDKVAASGKCDPFGLKLIKAKFMLEPSAYVAVQKELLQMYRNRYRDNETVSAAITCQALREYMNPACRECRGVGEMLIDERLITCASCNGSRTHRYSDEERARTMQISYAVVKRGHHKMRWLIELMGSADKSVNAVLSYELERGI